MKEFARQGFVAGLESAINCARSRAKAYIDSVSQYDREALEKMRARAAVLEVFADDLEKLKAQNS